MIGVCLVVAGVLRATIPEDSFTVAWLHSVQKTRWEERYAVDGDRLRIVDARVEGFGAGMEPAPGATLRDGVWTWTPELEPLSELRLTWSSFASDYELCTRTRCATLAEWAGHLEQGEVVSVRACAVDAAARVPG